MSKTEEIEKEFNKEEIEEIVLKIISEKIDNLDKFNAKGNLNVLRDKNLQSDLGLDSLSIIEISAEIEEKFNIQIVEAENTREDIKTPNDIINKVCTIKIK